MPEDALANASAEPRLRGSWSLASYTLHRQGAEPVHPMGAHPAGLLIYDDAGNMSAHLMSLDPPERPADARDGAAYEARISYDRYTSYFGRYSVDVASATVAHDLVGALMPGWDGSRVVRSYRFEGDDRLILSARTGRAGQERAVLIWRRLG